MFHQTTLAYFSRWKYPLRFAKRPPTKVDTVVVANMMGGSGGICESDDCKSCYISGRREIQDSINCPQVSYDGLDFAGRGDLPRQLAKQLQNTTILVWYNARTQRMPHCFVCKADGRVGDIPFYCEDYFTHTNT